MIRLDVIGEGQSDEREAAEYLQRQMREFWEGIEQDVDSDIRILVDVNCPGQRVEDLDIVVLAVFAKPRGLMVPPRDKNSEGRKFLLASLCAVIEVKNHRRDSIELRGDVLRVKYRDDWHDATRQNGQQVHSLVRHLEQRGLSAPYVYKFIWLRNVTRQELAQGRAENNPPPHNLLFSDSSIGNLFTSVWIDWQAKHPNTLPLYDDKLLIGSDRHPEAPADFDGISQTLTGQEMTLLPARASSITHSRRGSGYRGQSRPLSSNALTNAQPRRHTGFSFARLARSLPALLILLLIIAGGSLIGIQRLLAWIRPPVQTAGKGSVELAPFEGKYRCQRKSESYVLTLNREGDRLYASSVNGRIELVPVSQNQFQVRSDATIKSTFTFIRNAKGKVVSLTSVGDDGQKVVCPRLD